MNVDWWFRPEPPDRSRDFGNANIWTFKPDLDTFVREVGQNTLDVRVATTVDLSFRLIVLQGDELEDFLAALRWTENLRPHVEASVESGQKLGRSLEEGLRRLDETGTLTLLRVEEQGALGLVGEEFGSGNNFVGLCRNNLDSAKTSPTAGGAFGLGKAVLWRTSLLSTVLFNSDIDSEDFPEKDNRLIGRTELSWHEVGDGAFAGPGWFGNPSDDTAVSVWGDTELVKRLCLERPDSTGTSILIPAFHDPADDEEPSPADLADRLAAGVARSFWPAIESGRLRATVETATGRGDESVTSKAVVNAETTEPEFVAALRAHRDNAVVDALGSQGDVVRISVPLEVPRLRDGTQSEVQHEATLLVRRADPESDGLGSCVYFRGTEMIIERQNLRSVRVGAMPFHAIVLCGQAAGDDADATVAEEFLRVAEPPAHNTWELTPDLKFVYVQGGGAAIRKFFGAVRNGIRDAVGPVTEDLSDGPQKLKELFRIVVPTEPTPQRPEIASATGVVDGLEAWVIEGRLRIHDTARGWSGRPVVVFDAETGGGSRVKWRELEGTKNCEVKDGDHLVIPAGVKDVRFRGITDPASHPVPASASAVSVDFRDAQETDAQTAS